MEIGGRFDGGRLPSYERCSGEEIYGLTSQLRRAACSVTANIVEGSARESKRDYLHFLYIARGSLAETQYFFHLSRRLEYLSDVDAENLLGLSVRGQNRPPIRGLKPPTL